MTTAQIQNKFARLKTQSETYKYNLLQLEKNLHALHQGLVSFQQEITLTEYNFVTLIKKNTCAIEHEPLVRSMLPEKTRLVAS